MESTETIMSALEVKEDGKAWRGIQGYEGLYMVNDKGQILTLARLSADNRRIKQRVLNGHKAVDGYMIAMLTKFRKRKRLSIHRLVLNAFVGPPPTEKHECNHKNGIKHDNRAENLEWVTRSENLKHAHLVCTPRTWGKPPNHKGQSNKRSRVIQQLTLDGNLVKEYPYIQSACDNTDFNASKITQVAQGTRKSHGGFNWKFKTQSI